ncbi:MAG: 50S ribosomal protein L10 [Nanoarchaeota archaeon]
MTKKGAKKIPEKKVKTVNELVDLFNNKKTALLTSIMNIPSSKFQEISKRLRDKAIIRVPKKNLIFRAIDSTNNEKVKEFKKDISNNFAILFSEHDGFELASEILKSKTPARAKAGQIAPKDIEVEAGPTELLPGPAISELGAVGLQVQIEKGKIHIKEPKVIVRQGEEISEKVADIMGKLDIKPFEIGLIPVAILDTHEGKIYRDIKINKEETIENLKYAFGRALPFAVSINYFNSDTIKHIISKAGAYGKKLNAIVTGEPLEETVTEQPVETKKETLEEKPKEEEKEPAAAGLGALFG